MKQFIETMIPDKAVAWKLAAMALLFLLAVVLLVNTVVPFAAALFSPGKPADAAASGQAADPVVQENAQYQQTVADLELREAEANATIEQLTEQIAQNEAVIAELQTQGTADAEEIADLKLQIDIQNKQIEELTRERDEASQALADIREQLSKDYTVVIKLTRHKLFGGVADTLTYYHHVTEEEYAMYHIGDVIENITDLDFPVGNGWSAEVSNMMINYVNM